MPSNRGSPLWRRPSSAFGASTMKRSASAGLYQGKDGPKVGIGAYGGQYYDVRVSRTGTPRHRSLSTASAHAANVGQVEPGGTVASSA